MVAARVKRAFGHVDLIHAHVVLPAGLLGTAVAKTFGVPLIVQEHSGPFSMHLDTGPKRAAVNKTLRAAAIVSAVGDALAQRIEAQRTARDVCVMPNLMLTGLFAPIAIPDDRNGVKLVSVGSLEEIEGFDNLLDVFAVLQRSGLRVQRRIVGTGSLHETLSARLSELGLILSRPCSAHVPDPKQHRSSPTPACTFALADHETFGTAPAEALSVGRPVVTTRRGGPEAFVDDTCGAVVEPCDAHGLADAILHTWRRIDTFVPGQMHARINDRFGPDAFRRRMLALYDDVGSARVAA